MKKHPIAYLFIGIFFLVVPITVYLFYLVPQLTEEYNTLMSSGGIIGGVGYFASCKIPEKWKYSGIFKTASNAFTTLILITIVQEFINKLIVLGFIAIFSVILFLIFKNIYINKKRRKENSELAEEISRNIAENIK